MLRSALTSLAIGLAAQAHPVMAAGTQVWLTQGEVFLILENGEEVTLTAGNYLSCEEDGTGGATDGCEVLPLAIAPLAPASFIGGLATAPLAVAPATIIGSVVVPAVGIAAVATGVALSLSATNETNGTTSTPSTNN
ncbi:MAG: hypothetical protein AAF501_07920 [Pseudomonadota bacterium]